MPLFPLPPPVRLSGQLLETSHMLTGDFLAAMHFMPVNKNAGIGRTRQKFRVINRQTPPVAQVNRERMKGTPVMESGQFFEVHRGISITAPPVAQVST